MEASQLLDLENLSLLRDSLLRFGRASKLDDIAQKMMETAERTGITINNIIWAFHETALKVDYEVAERLKDEFEHQLARLYRPSMQPFYWLGESLERT